jgi:alcohol dehydrogenase class IV
MKPFSFQLPTRVEFGPGCARRVGEEARGAGVTKALLVTDRGIVQAGLAAEVQEALRSAGVGVALYDGVQTNPTLAVVEEAFALYRAEGCDGLVGVGGGSSIDTAKLVGVLATNPPPLTQYEGANKIVHPIPPLVAIPTAAGTGAEVTFSALFNDPERNYKASVRSPKQAARVALLDPHMLSTIPPHVAAATGLDTLTHALEGYVSTGASPMSDLLGLEAIRLTAQWLPQFVANPRNTEAASHMQVACVYAAVCCSNARLGNVHAMAHPLGGHFNLHHGVACAILLPHVMDFNLIGAPEKFAAVAQAMGRDVRGLSLWEAAGEAPKAVRDLMRVLGMPMTLREVGVTADRIPAMARDAVASGIHTTNPRATDLDTLVNLYKAAM